MARAFNSGEKMAVSDRAYTVLVIAMRKMSVCMPEFRVWVLIHTYVHTYMCTFVCVYAYACIHMYVWACLSDKIIK